MRINGREKRTGSLLTKNFRRIEVKDENYFRNLLIYIHYNPVRHGLTRRFPGYEYSSFKQIIRNQLPGISSAEIYNWYGGQELFFEKHMIIESDIKLKNLINEE
jgi:hypothetical protein